MKKNTDKALEILKKTNDGDHLRPRDLAILQAAVNNELNEKGQAEFDKIHANVMAGTYIEKWFHGIEHLTIKPSGYVFWKGEEVEHYNMDGYAYTERGREAATRIAKRCLALEKLGVEVNFTTVVWEWSKYEQKAKEQGLV